MIWIDHLKLAVSMEDRNMRIIEKSLIAILLVFFSFTGSLFAENSTVETYFGPRVGFTYIFTEPDDFNSAMQEIYSDPNREYFPLITQFGINLEQRIRLGQTRSHFALQELILIGGIDQNIPIPSMNFLIGFRSGAGLEIGIGPNLSMINDNGEVGVSLSVIYAIGWTFSFSGVNVPLNVAVMPTPKDGHLRLTLMSGFNWEL